jgi:hypothetical protein
LDHVPHPVKENNRALERLHLTGMRQLGKHHLTPLNLVAAESSGHFAMWAHERRLAGDCNPQVRMITRIDGFLKGNEPRAS